MAPDHNHIGVYQVRLRKDFPVNSRRLDHKRLDLDMFLRVRRDELPEDSTYGVAIYVLERDRRERVVRERGNDVYRRPVDEDVKRDNMRVLPSRQSNSAVECMSRELGEINGAQNACRSRHDAPPVRRRRHHRERAQDMPRHSMRLAAPAHTLHALRRWNFPRRRDISPSTHTSPAGSRDARAGIQCAFNQRRWPTSLDLSSPHSAAPRSVSSGNGQDTPTGRPLVSLAYGRSRCSADWAG